MANTNAAGGAFGRALADLKRRGSSLLLLGPPAPTLRRAASRRFLGDGERETRRRLFVLAEDAVIGPEVAVGPTTPETTRVIAWSDHCRSSRVAGDASGGTSAPASASESGELAGGTPPTTYPRRTVRGERLGSLAWAVGDGIDALERHATTLDPGELRICVDSLLPMLANRSPGEVRRLVETVGNRVRSVAGMAHYHLPLDRTDPLVDELEPGFDAVVELRLGDDDVPQHRWSFPDRDLGCDWLRL